MMTGNVAWCGCPGFDCVTHGPNQETTICPSAWEIINDETALCQVCTHNRALLIASLTVRLHEVVSWRDERLDP